MAGMAQLRLLTFGGLNLLVGGHATTGSATRRRRLALLALLAVARDRGLNRDKVQAYLWPESDTERARHGLNQLVYTRARFSTASFCGGRPGSSGGLPTSAAALRNDVLRRSACSRRLLRHCTRRWSGGAAPPS